MGQLYCILFLIQFICGFVFCEPDNRQLNDIIVQVSEYGLDVPSCILANGINPRPCKTLTYVLGQISTPNKFYKSTSIAININSNQSISLRHTYHFNLAVMLFVEVVGHNGTFINFKKNSLLEVCGSDDSYIYWTWASIGLGFMRSYGDQPIDSTGLVLVQKKLSFLATIKVKIMSISWHIIDTPTVVISYTYFGQDNVFCPFLSINFGISLLFPEKVATFNLFMANNFSFCQMSDAKDRLAILKINLKNYKTTLKLLNNTFTGLNHYPGRWVRAVDVVTNSITEALIENNRFNRNTIGMLYITTYDCYHTTSDFDQLPIPVCFKKIHLQNNYFQDNHDTWMLLCVQIIASTTVSDIFLRNNFFIANRQNSLIEVTIYSEVHIVIEKLHLIDNENTASVQLFKVDGSGSTSTEVTLAKLLIKNNIVSTIEPNEPPDELRQAVISLSGIHHLLFTDSTFINNSGTSFILTDDVVVSPAALELKGNIVFQNNTGLFGGACALCNIAVNTSGTGKIVFENNIAIYGGALFFDNVLFPSVETSSCNLNLHFRNNKATAAGNIVYFATSPPENIFQTLSCNITLDQKDKNFGSLTHNITEYENRSVLTVIPGQNIYMNVSIKDYFGSPSSCIADMYILCDNSLYNCFRKQIALIGPNSVLLAQVTFGITLDTNVRLSAPKDLNNTIVSIVFTCRKDYQKSIKVNLNISSCPLGFTHNSSECVCKCAKVTENNGTVICSEHLGITCIKQGYWYGPLNTSNGYNDSSMIYVSAPCSFPECNFYSHPCPSKMTSLGFDGDYRLLGIDADEQCSVGRGGLLCMSCAHGYEYTFLSISCVASISCGWWQPYLIIIICFLFEAIIAITLLLSVRFKLTTGLGFLYGPMLFLAVVSHLSFTANSEYYILRLIVLFMTSLPLLNPEPFGLIPWCFFHDFPKLYNYSLRYFGPLPVLIVIGLVAIIAHRCPRVLLKWQNSPIKALCILLLLSFWSLADITMNIAFNVLTPTRLIQNGVLKSSVVQLEPHTKYFSLQHLPAVLLAIIVLLAVIAPLLILLLFSPAMSKCISLYRIKPFLDEFQSCYQDRYRWYSGVYFIVWIVFITLQQQSVPIVYVQTTFTALLILHVFMQPYKSKLLNITDTLLLFAINFLLSLVKSDSQTTTIVFVHILVLGPILCVVVWFICVSFVKCGLHSYVLKVFRKKQPQNLPSIQQYIEEFPPSPQVPVQEVYLHDDSDEREPLIGLIDDS